MLTRLQRLENEKLASGADWDAMTAEALSTQLGRVLREHLPQALEPPLNLLKLDNGISIRKKAIRLAVVHEDRAAVGPRTIRGDFRVGGGHWDELGRALAVALTPEVKVERADTATTVPNREVLPRHSGWRPKSAPLPKPHLRGEQRPAPRRRFGGEAVDHRHQIDAVPDGVDPTLAALCLEASERIGPGEMSPSRIRSTCSHRVLQSAICPWRVRCPRLRAPFEVHVGHEHEVLGFLQLWTTDPLTLVFQKEPRSEDRVRVWAIVLLAFADLTVWPEREVIAPRREPRWRRNSTGRIPRTRTRKLPSPRRQYQTGRRGLTWEVLRSHIVLGHRRWLPDGWEASREKVREAAALGIELESGQTWVTEHTRAGVGPTARTIAIGVARTSGIS